MDASRIAPLHERLERLAAFLPIFEAPGFQFGKWDDTKTSKPGVFLMPFYMMSPEASAFCDALRDSGWMIPGFDWPAWMGTPEAERLRDDPEALARATPDQLARFLTVLIRQERFSEGGLGGCFESGLLTRILRRAEVLRSELA